MVLGSYPDGILSDTNLPGRENWKVRFGFVEQEKDLFLVKSYRVDMKVVSTGASNSGVQSCAWCTIPLDHRTNLIAHDLKVRLPRPYLNQVGW